MIRREDSIEVPYGWVVIIASLALHSIALGAPNALFVALKPIAADLGSLRSVPSFAYSLLMIGSGIGGVAMGFWMDKRGIVQPVLFGTVMIGFGAIVARPIGRSLEPLCGQRSPHRVVWQSGDDRTARHQCDPMV